MPSGADLIKRFEGLRLKAYQDVGGVWTVGYGATGSGIDADTVWTHEQAEADLGARLLTLQNQLRACLTVAVEPCQFAALTSLVYNIGLGAFRKSSVLRLLNAGDVEGAAEAFMSWENAAGHVVPGLVRRRALEREVFLDTEDTNPGVT